jgi:uncharacterized protein YkwD
MMMVVRYVTIVLSVFVLPLSGWASGQRPAGEAAVAAALITRIRSEHGLGPVRPDAQLKAFAAAQAAAMASAGVMAHDVAGDFASRIERAGLGRVMAAENLGAGYQSLPEVLEAWQKSAGHRENLLMSGITRIGLARDARAQFGGPYWALVLAGPEHNTKADRVAPAAGASSWLPAGIGLFVGH